MSKQDNINIASAINLSQIAQHPAEAMAALVEVVQRQEALLKEHEARLDKHSERIDELRYKEEPEPTEIQADRATILKLLLASQNDGKMFAKDARQKMRLGKSTFSRLLVTMKADIEVRPFHADRRRDLLLLRSENG